MQGMVFELRSRYLTTPPSLPPPSPSQLHGLKEQEARPHLPHVPRQ